MKLVKRRDIKQRMQSAIDELMDRCRVLDEKAQDECIRETVMKETAYAILSHRWLPSGEMTFQDTSNVAKVISGFQNLISDRKEARGGLEETLFADNLFDIAGDSMDGRKERHAGTAAFTVTKELCEVLSKEEKRHCGGFVKLTEFCNVAMSRYRCKYVWLDTGCINHSSSAELEESIRSMFTWYRNSEICIVHLNETTNALNMRRDAWFTRGWTLQELLAPRKIKFFDQFWQPLAPECYNDKISDEELGVPLWKTISDITKIPVSQLLSFEPGMQNIRERMVWASARKTTRIEDKAYCLLGIFDVSLSVAYGEGKMAFHRLQLEIMQRSDDMGLFAWRGQPSAYNSMLAAGPECFVRSLSGLLTEVEGSPDLDTTYALTNRGLRMSLSVYTVESIRDVTDILSNGYGDRRSGIVENDSDGSDIGVDDLVRRIGGGLRYELMVEKFGIIGTALRDPPDSECLKVAVLGNASQSTSAAVLLAFSQDTRRYRRVRLLEVKRLPRWKEPEIVFIQ